MLNGFGEGLRRTYGRFWGSETAVMLTMALLVGLGSGFGAVVFRWLIEATHVLFFETLPGWLTELQVPGTLIRYTVVMAPALGGLIAGLVIHSLAPAAQGPGVSSVMEALALRGGAIRPLIIAVKPIATSFTIGSGGSAGREGPVVQIGSAIGSALSQVAGLSADRTKNLVACGAAGGIAATFNAPLAGVMFALEVLLAEFRLVQFTSVVVAAVIASVIGHTYLGDVPAFPFPPLAPPGARELPVYALLGVAAALLGVGFSRALHYVGDLFAEQPLPPYMKPALGGLLVGLLGLWFPQVLGVGYDSIEAVLFNRLTLPSIIILGLLKIAATSLTIGSGGSGGIFGPCLFIGAMLGGVVAQLVQQAAPDASAPPAYALVGMSAVFAAASQAPITAVLTLFEMTRDYTMILPLMLASGISAIAARHLLRDSIYTLRLSRRGIDVDARGKIDLMGSIRASEAMTPLSEMVAVAPSTPLAELARIFDETHLDGLVVLDENRRLQGVVSLSNLEQAQAQQLVSGKVADIQTTNVRTVFPDQSVKAALQHFGALDVGRIPVVERAGEKRVVGVLRRGDIMRAYSHAILDQQAQAMRQDRAKLVEGTGLRESSGVVQVRLTERHVVVGKTVKDLDLPSQSLIASIRRGEQLLIPRGDTLLQAGDIIIALTTRDKRKSLRDQLTRATNRR